MTDSILCKQSAAITNGPTFFKNTTISATAYDMVSTVAPANVDGVNTLVTVDVQPSDSDQIEVLFITSDNYNSVSYVVDGTTSVMTAGYRYSAASPSTDISAKGTGAHLKIKVDGDGTWREVIVDATLLNTGAKIATAIQAAIRALGSTLPAYKYVRFVYANNIYTCYSGTVGTNSKVLIDSSLTNDIAASLYLGVNPA